MTETDRQALFNEADPVAVDYFKEKFEVEIVITDHNLLPTMAVSEVSVIGHVKDHQNLKFDLTYDYEKKVVTGVSISQEFSQALKDKGFDLDKTQSQTATHEQCFIRWAPSTLPLKHCFQGRTNSL